MPGLLTGLLGVTALPPIGFELAGLLWLVPWLSRLNRPRRERVVNALLAIGLPVGFALGPAVPGEPAIALLAMLLAILPFVAAGAIAANGAGHTGGLRIGLGLGLLCVLLAVLRQTGLPLSLSLFAPALSVHLQLIGAAGIIGADLLLAAFQGMLALTWMRATSRAWPPWRALGRAGVMTLALALGPALIPLTTQPDRAFPARTIAVVQTDIKPWERRRAVADGVLERIHARQGRLRRAAEALDADVVAWPEAAAPGYLRPAWETPLGEGPVHLRHGYRYLAPGRITSVVRAGRNGEALRTWRKRYPLPFAESQLTPASPAARPRADALTGLSPLICSDASHPIAMQAAARAGTGLIINPSNSAYVGSPTLARLHERSVHREAAAAGLPALVITNGGPSAVLPPNGRRRELLGTYQRGVVRITLRPQRHRSTLPGLAVCLLMAASLGTLGILARGPVAPDRAPRRGAWWPAQWIVVLATFSLVTSIAQSAVLNAHAGPDAPWPFAARTGSAAIHAPGQPHRGAIALLAREAGLPVGWRQVPGDPARARQWLCRRTGLMLANEPLEAARAPALGLRFAAGGLEAVRWLPGREARAWDPVSGRFHPVGLDAVHWLVTAESPDQCRSRARRE